MGKREGFRIGNLVYNCSMFNMLLLVSMKLNDQETLHEYGVLLTPGDCLQTTAEEMKMALQQ